VIAEIEKHRVELEGLCRRYRVRRLELFGSATTAAYRPGESDIDLLVEFEVEGLPGYADRYFGLLESLEQLFGVSVDLVVATAIKNPYLLDAVTRTKAPLYAA